MFRGILCRALIAEMAELRKFLLAAATLAVLIPYVAMLTAANHTHCTSE